MAVIGAGIAGMAVAIRLAHAGHKVSVFEANNYAGGKLGQLELNGYRFDTGPSLFTLPHLVDELLNLTDKNSTDYFAYTRLPVVCKYFYEDGTVINGYAKPRKFCGEVYEKTGTHPQKVWAHLQNGKRLYEATKAVFLERSLHKASTYFSLSALKALHQLCNFKLLKNMHQSNSEHFKDVRVQQLFNRFATYNGSDPYRAPALLNLIPHLEHGIGAYFPAGGMYAIAKCLHRVAEEVGVRFHLNSKVERILLQGKHACGILVNGEKFAFDTLVSNADVNVTYRKLLPNVAAPEKILQREPSGSAIVFYWGIKHDFGQLDLHNIFFSADYKREFECIFKDKSIYNDPTVYVNISSKFKRGDAPKGCQNWFVMLNAPSNTGQDWEAMAQQCRRNILKKLSRILKRDIESLISVEKIMTPLELEAQTSSFGGALYGSASNSPMAAFFRHPNFSRNIKNLYFCGGSVHPGGGIPLCLQSAKITANLIGT